MVHPWDEGDWLPGVLSKKQLIELIKKDYLEGFDQPLDEDEIGYSSFDLHLSAEGYRLIGGSIKPCTTRYHEILKDERLSERLRPNDDGEFELEVNQCYVFILKERFDIGRLSNSCIYAQGTAKSSIGRLDVIARLIVDGMIKYESMTPDCLQKSSGRMYLEIIPISFNIKVKEGVALSQLRLFRGAPEESLINDIDFIKNILKRSADGKGYLSVDLSNTTVRECEVAAFKACPPKDKKVFINAWKDKDNLVDPCSYWTFVKADQFNRLRIEKNEFYIIRSKERISLPSGVALYARAMDETLGEMRIHYAGFAHPFFGKERKDGVDGTPLIFEVRGHSVDVNLNDGEALAQLAFYRMSESAEWDEEDNSYNEQELTLSGIFNDWPDCIDVDDAGRVTGK